MKSRLRITMIIIICGMRVLSQTTQNDKYREIVNFKFSQVSYVDWSPDGEYLAVVAVPDVYVIDYDTWEIRLLIPDAEVSQVQWSPDGIQLASVQGGANEKLIIWDASTGEEVKRIVRPNNLNSNQLRIFRLSWNPDGMQIVSDSSSPDILLWDLTDDSVSVFASHVIGVVGETDWSPDGSMIASTGAGGTMIWDAVTAERLLHLKGDGFLDWSPSKYLLLSHGDLDKAEYFVDVWNVDRGHRILRVEHDITTLSVRWDSQGRLFASGGLNGVVKVWDIESSQLVTTIEEHQDMISMVAWHPDKQILATASLDGQIYVWLIHG